MVGRTIYGHLLIPDCALIAAQPITGHRRLVRWRWLQEHAPRETHSRGACRAYFWDRVSGDLVRSTELLMYIDC